MARMPSHLLLPVLFPALLAASLGCGSTKSRIATEQLLVSDAVDHAVTGIDFRALAGKNVYFDTRYLVNVKGIGFVNSEYIISSLRQQMVAADVRLKDKLEDAELVVEARVGALGSDGNEVVYGVPASKGLSEVSAYMPSVPPVPSIPEISVARKESQLGAAKIAAFAYDRETGDPIWQSGISKKRTTSQDVWFFGIGPFQRGSIHPTTELAGGEVRLPKSKKKKKASTVVHAQPVPLDQSFVFSRQHPGAGMPPPDPNAPPVNGQVPYVANQPQPVWPPGTVPLPPVEPPAAPQQPPAEPQGALPPGGPPPVPPANNIPSPSPSLR